MAYSKKMILKQALEVIEQNNLFFIDDIITYLPCSRATFYNYELDKLDELKEKLNHNKIVIKSSLRNKWYKSENATLQMALYKLLATDDERRRLSMQYIDHTSEGEKITGIEIIFPDGKTKDKANEKAA